MRTFLLKRLKGNAGITYMAESKKPEEVLGSPMQEYYLEVDEAGAGVERFYFWVLNFLTTGPPSGQKCDEILKIKDIYAATETSSYFGSIEQRKGLQQDRVSQYLATIGKMIKDLFQIIRELKIMDERYSYYKDSQPDEDGSYSESANNAEVALKSIWIDMVEGGAKNPTSVLGLGSQVGFTILPDLFFTIHPRISEDVEGSRIEESIRKETDKLGEQGINRKIQEVLGRKLYQYLIWKKRTKIEIKQRRNFMLKYLRQHYNTIKMYMDWVRPYLQNLRRLQMKQNPEDPYLIAAFESSKVELELIGKWNMNYSTGEPGRYNSYIRVEFTYVTIPQMAYQQEYQRGAIHTGKSIIKLKTYALEEETIKKYKEALMEQDLELLEGVTGSMDALKDDLKSYLKEAGEDIFKEDIRKVMEAASATKEEASKALEATKGDIEKAISHLKQSPPTFNPIKDILSGFKEMFAFKKPEKEEKSKKSHFKPWQDADEKSAAAKKAQGSTYIVYDIFKKAHRYFAW